MKIVFVITGLAVGGAENMLLRVIERLDKNKFTCHVFSLTDIGEVGSKIVALGVPVEALNMHSLSSFVLGFYRLVKRLRHIQPNLVHTWMYHADLIGGFATRIAKVDKLIWCVRSSDFLQSDTKFSTRFIFYLCAMVSKWLPSVVLYNSKKGLEYHKKMNYREPCSFVIFNGIDTDLYKPDEQARLDIRRELGIPPTTSLVGIIGRYDVLKNHRGFIQAAMYTHKVMPEVHFLLVGKDVDQANSSLMDMVNECGLGDSCHLLGSRFDIPRIMAALDLLTLTSWSEAFPNVLIEAMSCGVPCVSTDAGDSALILDGVGWVVPVGEMVALANQWVDFLHLNSNKKKQYAMRARNSVIDRFDIEVVVQRYEQMYRDVAGECLKCTI